MSRRRAGLRNFAASVITIAAFLSTACAVAAFADERRQPSGAQVAEGIEGSLREAEQFEQTLSEEGAVQERIESQGVYSEMSGSEAKDLLLREFGEWLEQFDSEPARFLSEHRLVESRSQTTGLVRVDGDQRLMDAGIPMQAPSEDGLVKVDLSIAETGDGYAPENALVDLALPEQAGDAIEIGEDGLVVEAVSVNRADGQIVDDLNLFYPNVRRDTDLLLAPVSRGVEIFNQLRSAGSPESLAFRIELPANGDLRIDENGGADVVVGSEIVAKVHPPSAFDAQGQDVPVDLTVDGDELRLSVGHRGGEFAYPILVDPVVEDWTNPSWYSGWNYAALNYWSYTANNGWIYGKTECINKVWCPAPRGLYISASSGNNRPANNYGHWSYTAPGWSSRVVQYAVTPFWRNNNGCPASQYGQPHDYVGIWNGSSYSGLQTDEANDVGGAWGTGIGQTLNIGLGTAGQTVPNWPCWRDIYIGGVAVWLDDPDWPTWSANPTIADQWVDGTGLPISVSASDSGLGMKYFNVFKTNTQGNIDSLVGYTAHSCSGGRAAPCPSSWNTSVSYNPAMLDEGIRVLGIHAYDALGVWPHPGGVPHYSELKTVLSKVDRSKPEVIQISGGLVSPGVPTFDLQIQAKDGSASSLQTARSGVEKMRFYLDGNLVDEKAKVCTNVPSPPAVQINWASCEMVHDLKLNGNLSGAHELKEIAVDSLGHASNPWVQNINIPADQHDPTVSVKGQATKAILPSGNHPLTIESTDAQTGVRKLKLLIDNKLAYEDSQSCPNGGCSMNREVNINITNYPSGPHMARVIALDDKGNDGEVSWEFTHDNQAPQMLPIEPVSPLPGWIAVDRIVSFHASAKDPLSGVDRFEVTRPADRTMGPGKVIVTTYDTDGKEALKAVSIPTIDMASGVNTVTVKAIDNMGNVSGSVPIEVKIDRAAPVIKTVKGQLIDGAPVPPSPPANVKAAEAAGKVTLTWSASTDDVGVTGYAVYRSTNAGFTPSSVNRIGSTGTTNYVDLPPVGTHYYRVKAIDAASNYSASSPESSGSALSAGPSAPVAAYAFNDGAGTVAHDETGNGHDGEVDGPSWTVAGKHAGALEFHSGEEDCVSVPNAPELQLTEEFTLEAWVRPEDDDLWGPVFFKQTEWFAAYGLYVGFHKGGTPEAILATDDYELATAEGDEELPEGTWSHVAATYDGTHLRLYVDGELVDTSEATETIESDGPLMIGCSHSSWEEDFIGKIDDARIYDRALSAAELEEDAGEAVQTVSGASVHPIGRFSDFHLEVSDVGSGVEKIELRANGKLLQEIVEDELVGHEVQTCTIVNLDRTCELKYDFSVDLGPEQLNNAAQVEIQVTDKVGRTDSEAGNDAPVDNQSPGLELGGALAEADGHELQGESAALTIEADDVGSSSETSGIAELEIAVDGEKAHTESFDCLGSVCPDTVSDDYIYKRVSWGPGPHEVVVSATDGAGNAHTERITVDGVITAVAPECPSGQPAELESSHVISPEAAASAASAIVPGATAATESPPGGEEFLDPQVTTANVNPVNNDGIDVVGTEAGGGIEDGRAASFTVAQAVCLAPVVTTSAEAAPLVLGGDAVVYANTAPSTDTVIRPTAYGTTVTQNLRDADAPDSFEWDVALAEGQIMEELPNGAIAIVEPNGIGFEEMDVPSAPGGAMSPDALQDVETQIALANQELAEAQNYVEGSVIAVIGAPMVVLGNGSVTAGVIVMSSATSIKVEPPPGAVEEAVALVVRANASSDPRAICAQLFGGSPEDYYDGCGPIREAEEGAEAGPEAPEYASFVDVPKDDPKIEKAFESALNAADARLARAERTPADSREADLMFCNDNDKTRLACPFFAHDSKIAIDASERLWNFRAEGVKSDGFEHGVWAALLIQTDVLGLGQELEDFLAVEFLANHEKHRRGLYSKSWTERYGSRMDLLNDEAGLKIADLVTSDLAACDLALDRARDGIHLGSETNPARWAERFDFKAHRIVYRHQKFNGKTVGALSDECGDVGIF